MTEGEKEPVQAAVTAIQNVHGGLGKHCQRPSVDRESARFEDGLIG